MNRVHNIVLRRKPKLAVGTGLKGAALIAAWG
jgi:hypothetical protein